MTKENQNVTFYRGVDKTIRVTMTTNGDISTWKLQASVRIGALSVGNELIKKQNTAMGGGNTQIEVTVPGSDTSPGTFLIKFVDTDTEALAPRDYIWDVKRMDDNAEDVLAVGKLTLKAGPTR